MAQKFIGLDDAAKQLGATKDQLNALREAGELRGYRDGASWKFRTDDIDALAASGLPSASGGDSSDDLSLDALGDGLSSDSLAFSDDLSIDLGEDIDLGDGLSVADETDDSIQPASPSPESDPELAAVDEPTVAADEDAPLDAGDDDDDAESILLTDASVGGSPDRPPSTIIGKSELVAGDDDDLDLELAPGSAAAMSDVKLVRDEDDEDIRLEPEPSADAASQFEGLEELEIDLEAESSRILEAEDLKAAQSAAAKQKASDSSAPDNNALDSDMALAPGSDLASLTGLSSLASAGGDEEDFELAGSSISGPSSALGGGDESENKGPGSSAVLTDDDDDDFVLGGDSDSDVTMSGADSGINLAPADSGLALDDASLDLSGMSAGGSSLDLSESFGAALTDAGDDDDASSIVSAEVSGSEDFLLQPAVDDESDMEEDSSQIIALEEVADEGDEVMLGDDVGFGAPEEMGAAVAPAGAVAAVEETQFGGLTISLLACSIAGLALCGIMSVDMIRTIWSWDEGATISSGILDSLASLMGLRN